MKTFFQYSEQAKRHARKKMLNEAAPAGAAQPDYAKFTAAWTEFVKDPNNAAVVQAMGKTMLSQVGTELQKLQKAAPAPTAQAPATGTAPAPAAGGTAPAPAAAGAVK